MIKSSRIASVLITRGGALALVAFAITLWIAPEQVPDGEAAELAILGDLGGVAHPPGYPLYLIYMRLTSWLPGATPAHTAAIGNAILGAVQLLVLHAACRAWGARPLAATAAVAIYAAGPLVMRYHSQAEVFALNGLLIAGILWLAAKQGPLRGERRVIALGLVAGLGIANHHTCVLIAPVGLYGAVLGLRETSARVRAACVGLVALCVGLAPYAYLLATGDNRQSWGTIDELRQLIAHFLREDYGGASTFASGGGDLHPMANLAALGYTLGRAWLWIPLLGALAVLAMRAWRSPDGTTWGWRMLAMSWLLAGPVLVLRFNLEPVGFARYAIERFHLMPALLLVLPAAFAIDWVSAKSERLGVAAVTGVAIVGHLALAILAMPRLAQERSPALERIMENLITSMPPDAVIFADGDAPNTVVNYIQMTRNIRPDVTVVKWRLVPADWYRARLVQRGIVFDRESDKPSIEIARKLLDAGRPVFVDLSMGNLLETFAAYPYGLVFRVVPANEKRPSIQEVFAINKRLVESYKTDYPPPGRDDGIASVYHEQYAHVWRIIAKALAAEHDPDAAWALAAADTFAPK